jgi:4a-hydroxytetrahydrobiopterin dehydratase
MSDLHKKQWNTQTRRAMSPTELVAKLVELPGWVLDGDGANVAIQKTFRFANYLETMSFANAVAFVAERNDHHPEMNVQYASCQVRFNTHDVNGVSITDFECAAQVQAWVSPR